MGGPSGNVWPVPTHSDVHRLHFRVECAHPPPQSAGSVHVCIASATATAIVAPTTGCSRPADSKPGRLGLRSQPQCMHGAAPHPCAHETATTFVHSGAPGVFSAPHSNPILQFPCVHLPSEESALGASRACRSFVLLLLPRSQHSFLKVVLCLCS